MQSVAPTNRPSKCLEMTQNKLSLKEIREKVINDKDKEGKFKNAVSIDGIVDIEEHLEELDTEEEREHFRKLVQRRVMNDLFPSNKKAIVDDALRNKIIAKNSLRVEPQCRICNSIFY